ncbi:APC family permease [Fructilactobacillus vespulae]|uniref:APC family permease n=1 Tax=Fructilactobacillus vespulae TaxID=1249630 RepID=UPI0039B65D48
MDTLDKQKLGFKSMVLLGINSIIGTGIFLLPSIGMKLFGPASILALLFDAFLAFLLALCFAECAGQFSETGGAYVYAKEAFGNFVGYEIGFITWAIRIIAESTLYVGFALALSGVFPSLATPTAKNIIVTIFALALMCLNIRGVKLTAIVNNIFTVSKLIPLFLVVVVGLFFIKAGNFHPFFVPQLTTTGSFATTCITLFLVFTGFEGVVVVAGEMKDAKKNLPKTLLMSFGIVALLYIAIVAVCIGVLGKDLTGTSVPLQAVFTKVAGSVGGDIIALGTILSLLGVCVASSFVTPRSGVALAENKMMPAVLAKTNKYNAPYVSIIVSTLITLVIAYSGTFETLAQISVVSRFAQYLPTCLAVLVFRRRNKNHSGFRVPFGSLIPVSAIIVSLVLLSQAKMSNLVWGLGSLVIAVPFYFLTGSFKENKQQK